jgi:D-alanyl-D-alanine carboxypeptidase
MNDLTRRFKLRDTKFANPHGLSNKFNKSTAADMAKLSFHAMKNYTFREIVKA